MAQPQSQEAAMSREATDCSSVMTTNSVDAPIQENLNIQTVTREGREEEIVAMKHLKSTKEEIKETTSRDLHGDNDNVSFLLEEPRSSLKKGFNIEVRSVHTVSPLQTQIAGHGSENDGQRGLLVHESGFVLKPVQAPPKGTREVAFYQSINSSEDEFDQRLVQLTARFYGTQAVKVQNGVVGLSDYLVLENLTQGLGAPCVMDVKIGARTYGPDASEAKKKQEDAKYQGTKVPFGFSVLGIISHNKEGVKRLNKAFGRSLCAKNIHDVLTNFIRLDSEQSVLVANIFSEKLDEFIEFFGSQRRYHLYASSLLFVYDFASLQAGNLEEFKGSVRLKLIDFAHVFPANGGCDENFIFGLKNLSDLFRIFIADRTT